MTTCAVCRIDIEPKGFGRVWRSVAVVPYPGYTAWCYGKAAGTLHRPSTTKENTVNNRTKIIAATIAIGLGVTALAGCSDAQVTSDNLSTAADNFEIERRVTFYNSITDAIMYEVEGRCSITVDSTDRQLEVTCKIGPDEYVKHFLGLSDNVTYLVEQTEFADVDEYHYRFIIKPEAIIPEIDVNVGQTDTGD